MRGMVYLATVIVTKTVPSEHNPALSPTFISLNSVMTKNWTDKTQARSVSVTAKAVMVNIKGTCVL